MREIEASQVLLVRVLTGGKRNFQFALLNETFVINCEIITKQPMCVRIYEQ